MHVTQGLAISLNIPDYSHPNRICGTRPQKRGFLPFFHKNPGKKKKILSVSAWAYRQKNETRAPRFGLTCPGGFPYNALTPGNENGSISSNGKFFYLP
jgi:hypothetical protein